MWKLSLESLSKFWGTEHIDTWNILEPSSSKHLFLSEPLPVACPRDIARPRLSWLCDLAPPSQHGMVCMAWHQWPCQEPKLEVPTIYKARVREYPSKIWPYISLYGTDWYSSFILGSWNSHWSISHLPHLQSTQNSPKHRTDPPPPSHISWLCLSTRGKHIDAWGILGYPLVMTNSLLLKMAIYNIYSSLIFPWNMVMFHGFFFVYQAGYPGLFWSKEPRIILRFRRHAGILRRKSGWAEDWEIGISGICKTHWFPPLYIYI